MTLTLSIREASMEWSCDNYSW